MLEEKAAVMISKAVFTESFDASAPFFVLHPYKSKIILLFVE